MKKYNYLINGEIVYLIRNNKTIKVEVEYQTTDSGNKSTVKIFLRQPGWFNWQKYEFVKRYELLSEEDISEILEERIKETYITEIL